MYDIFVELQSFESHSTILLCIRYAMWVLHKLWGSLSENEQRKCDAWQESLCFCCKLNELCKCVLRNLESQECGFEEYCMLGKAFWSCEVSLYASGSSPSCVLSMYELWVWTESVLVLERPSSYHFKHIPHHFASRRVFTCGCMYFQL